MGFFSPDYENHKTLNFVNIFTIIQIIVSAIFVIFFTVGLTFILSDYFHIPTLKVSQTVKHFSKRQPRKNKSFIDNSLGDLSRFVAKHLRLNEYKKISLKNDLHALGIEQSPEEYTAFAIVKALLTSFVGFFVVAVFCLALGFFGFILPVGSVVDAIFFFVFYRNFRGNVSRRLAKKREAIEDELPRFIAIVEQQIKQDRDIIKIMDKYKATAGPDFADELNITVADMRSGNYEQALIRLEERVNSSIMSDVSRGLISIVRGNDTEVFWANLSAKCSELQKQKLKKKASKIPGKINKLAMVMLFCFVGMFFFVIIYQAVVSLQTLFA